MLVDNAKVWSRWNSVQQLTHHSFIKETLLGFCAKVRYPSFIQWVLNSHPSQYPCHQHNFLLAQPLVINDDDNDLLCHLLYCCRKQELYELPDKLVTSGHNLKESEQVIELLWQVNDLAPLEVSHW